MIDSPEVLELDDSEFRLLVSTWCLAKVEDDHGSVSFTRTTLRRRTMPFKTAEEFDTMIDHLISLDLLWEAPNGKFLVQRWDTHQYEYPSRIPSNRSDYGKTSENDRKEDGKNLEAQGQIEPEPEPEPDLKDQEIPPVSPPKPKRVQPLKKQYAPNVTLTAQEHQDLIAEHGEEAITRMIAILDAYKQQSGKAYKSDAGAIRNWVIERYQKGVANGNSGSQGCQHHGQAAKDDGIDWDKFNARPKMPALQ